MAAAAAATAAAAAVRRLLCCGCSRCLFRNVFLNKKIKTGGSVVVMIVVIEPGRAAAPQLIWRGHRHLHPRPTAAAAAAAAAVLLLRCCCCCAASHSLVRVFQTCSAFAVAGDRCCCAWILYTSPYGTFFILFVFFLWYFYRKLSQMHAGATLAFFKPDGRVFGVFFYTQTFESPKTFRDSRSKGHSYRQTKFPNFEIRRRLSLFWKFNRTQKNSWLRFPKKTTSGPYFTIFTPGDRGLQRAPCLHVRA